MKYSSKRQFGNRGEDCAVLYLRMHGFQIIERNVLRKWGEIDIVAFKNRELHFIEVKTSHIHSPILPEANMTADKLRKCLRSARMYMSEHRRTENYHIDCIFVYAKGDRAEVVMLNDIV